MATPHDHAEHEPVTPESSLTLDLFGSLITFQVRSAETEGAYAILEAAVPPGRAKVLMHSHAAAETFQILDGEFEFHAVRDGQVSVFRASAGDMVHMPPNVPHGYRNVAKEVSSFQTVVAPGSMEGYFLELGMPTAATRPTKPTAPDLELLGTVGEKYGVALYEE
ncbi:hypothetical protein GCM10011507_20410 [Edaphobacter acidisoli]|uniref:Cupin type-2 domain-containing protein n=1 Tax=Edaphobacter acidisoli TaxID=2040573 RepID=A0A916RV39_9BACT|nr:cupin domain-containing protein [Edaphobacter acidisoli]GGA68853.1 hypothetical protein GCM10011507_20410 [Edaphobacter acidisoli]